MNIPKLFYLSGHAYLESIFFDESKCIAKLKAIHPDHQDEIYLDCEVHGILEDHLLNLLQEVKNGNSVIVSFTTAYHKFKTAISAFSPEDENSEDQIVILSCKLLALGNCYINSNLIDKKYFHFLKTA